MRLQLEMRSCTRCGDAGHAIAPGAVFSGGVAPWMIVGQAPGETESRTRTPFCGPSGRRLFQWLAGAGWAEQEFRATQYITAVTKCYPGKAGRGDRAPSHAERLLCEPFLRRELELVDPRVIVAVGRVAMERFLGPGRLAERVGRSFRLGNGNRTVVPLPHPSGANLWLNATESRRLLNQAVDLLRELRRGRDA